MRIIIQYITLFIFSSLFLCTISYAQDVAKESPTKTELKLPDNIDEDEDEKLEEENKKQTKTTDKAVKKTNKKSSVKNKKKRRKKKRKYPTNRPKRALKSPPPLGKIPFALGERLTYKINLLNAHSGTVVLKVGKRGTYEGRKVIEFSGSIKSSPFIENFYPIRDRLIVLADEKTFLPVKSDFLLNEKKRESRFKTTFDIKTGKIKWEKTVKKRNKTYKRKYKGPGQLYESLSSLYALRRLDLKVGLHFEHYVWSGRRERLVSVKVIGEERVLTDLGWFETYKVEISSVITGGFIGKRDLKRKPMKGTAWIAKDQYLTPVKLITPTKLGEAEALLTHKGRE